MGLTLGYLLSPSPPARVEVKTVTKEVTVWKDHTVIRTLPGATIYRDAAGGTTITGPVVLDSQAEGSTSRTVDSHSTIESKGWDIAFSAGVLLPRPAVQVGIDYNIGTLFRKVGVGVGVIGEWPWTSYVPNRGGVRVTLTF